VTKREIIVRGMAGFEERKSIPPEERFQQLVQAGTIDNKGHVLWSPSDQTSTEHTPKLKGETAVSPFPCWIRLETTLQGGTANFDWFCESAEDLAAFKRQAFLEIAAHLDAAGSLGEWGMTLTRWPAGKNP